MMRKDSRGGHILYLMVHFPFVWWFKVGITGQTAKKRAAGLDRAMWGFPIPIMILFLPGAYGVEQDLHRHFKIFNCRFYRGDGSSEFFWFPVAFVVFPLMVSGWIGYVWLVDLMLGTDFHTVIIHWIVDFLIILYGLI